MSKGLHSLDYPNARFTAVEIDLATGCHQILTFPSASYTECIQHCQSRPPITPGKYRQLLLAHKDAGE